MTRTLGVPGFVSAHSHTFVRALRGRDADAPLQRWARAAEELARADRRETRTALEHGYRELRAAGITAVGEFNLLGPTGARDAVAAAAQAGIQVTVVHPAAAHGPHPHRQPSVAAYLDELDRLRSAGIPAVPAVCSVTACPRSWLEEIGRHAATERLPLHVPACERPEEVRSCLDEHGCRPIELLARTGCLGPHVTVVHATHADGPELDLVAAHGATICACPTGDAFLGNGFLPVTRIVHRAIPLTIGTDVCARIDPLEELRQLEGIARRQKGARGVLPVEVLLEIGGDRGVIALGLSGRADVEIDLDRPALAGVATADVPAALVHGCGADVIVEPGAVGASGDRPGLPTGRHQAPR